MKTYTTSAKNAMDLANECMKCSLNEISRSDSICKRAVLVPSGTQTAICQNHIRGSELSLFFEELAREIKRHANGPDASEFDQNRQHLQNI